MSATPAASRRRHPSAQPPVPAPKVVARVARMLGRTGARCPQVAAAVLHARGRSGLSPDDFAGRLGIEPDQVRSAEAGELAVDELPDALRSRVRAVLLDVAPRRSA